MTSNNVNNASLVSITMPSYNHAKYIGQTIDSIRLQTYSNWELIIVDDGSDDSTEEIVHAISDPRIQFFKAGETLQIGDMENVTEHNFNTVIQELKLLAGKLGLKQIQFHCSAGISLNKLFTLIIDPAPSFPVIIKDFGSQIPMNELKFTLADIDIF